MNQERAEAVSNQTRHTGNGQRPDGLHTIPDDFAITDAERRWAHATYPGVDVNHETDQFIRYWRSEGRRKKNWHDAWQKWIGDATRRTPRPQQGSFLVALNGGNDQPARTLTGTDAKVAGWAAVAEQLRQQGDSA